jgi:ferredoxin
MAYKVIHYWDKCIGCGNCAAICPKHWDMAKDGMKSVLKSGKKKGKNYELELDKDLQCNKDAEESCQVDAIEVKE